MLLLFSLQAIEETFYSFSHFQSCLHEIRILAKKLIASFHACKSVLLLRVTQFSLSTSALKGDNRGALCGEEMAESVGKRVSCSHEERDLKVTDFPFFYLQRKKRDLRGDASLSMAPNWFTC